MYSRYILESHQRSRLSTNITEYQANDTSVDNLLDQELVKVTEDNLKKIKSSFFALYNSFFTIANCDLKILNCFVNKNCNEEITKLIPPKKTLLSENSFGTNAIALAAYKKDVAYVIKDEHYRKSSKKLSCVAAPVEINRNIIGYIGLSTTIKGETNGLRAFIESLAQNIAGDILRTRIQKVIVQHMKQYKAFNRSDKIFSILSDRERCVLSYIIKGYQNEKIANEMGISEKTVKTYLQRLFEKLEINNRIDAALFYLLYEMWTLIKS